MGNKFDHDFGQRIFPAETPGSLGYNDQGDPSVYSLLGETPGPMGFQDAGELLSMAPSRMFPEHTEHTSAPFSGAVPVGVGAGAKVRIPMPGSGGLHVEFFPRPGAWVPKKGSTSTLFIQNVTGKRLLRLDYDVIEKGNKAVYHWNQKGVLEVFKIYNHTPARPGGKALYEGARYFRHAGRTLGVVGLTVDLYSIVVAKKRWRRTAQVASGWVGAVAGCKVIGVGGAALGTAVKLGGGTAIGGVGGCIVGGIAGYSGAEWAAGPLYDWVGETFFEPLPEVEAPPGP